MIRMVARIFVLAAAICSGRGASADETVDVALAMVADVSTSIDAREFALQKQGYVAAFLNRGVLDAIHGGRSGAIEVTYLEFAGDEQLRTVVDWTVIRSEKEAAAFADRIAGAPRSFTGVTAIGAGIDLATKRFADAPLPAGRRIIDVSGDGANNSGPEPGAARDHAIAAGITINGLAINNAHPAAPLLGHVQPEGGLVNYYRLNVAGGQGSFVIVVDDFQDIGQALAAKLVTEIAALP